MADLKRTIKCSNCGAESTVYVNCELEMSELIVAGKCRCGNTMQVSYNIVASGTAAPSPSSSASTPASPDSMVNLDDALFGGETPSDTLRSIMED